MRASLGRLSGVTALAALMALGWPSAQAPLGITTLQAGDIVFRGGLIFDAVGNDAVPNTGLIVHNGTILEVGVALTGRDLGAARVIDLAATECILPGLFDLHAHYAMDLFGEGRYDEHTVNPILFLANGVTSTFPAGEVNPEEMRAARERIDAGQQIGPRIYNSGPYFGTARPGWNNAQITPERIRADVDEWAAKARAASRQRLGRIISPCSSIRRTSMD
jgi:N-acetylglucosamine-6-phosphate deacetylase